MLEAWQTTRPQPAISVRATRAARLAGGLLADRLWPPAARSLPRLADVYPRASQTARRWRGPGVVAVSSIVGTAAALPGTRRTDFLPTGGHEPADWQGRWNRLQAAARDLTPLPPIELVKAGDGYWVLDGHNRVALAKSTGQVWIDADVTEVSLPAPPTQDFAAQRGAI